MSFFIPHAQGRLPPAPLFFSLPVAPPPMQYFDQRFVPVVNMPSGTASSLPHQEFHPSEEFLGIHEQLGLMWKQIAKVLKIIESTNATLNQDMEMLKVCSNEMQRLNRLVENKDNQIIALKKQIDEMAQKIFTPAEQVYLPSPSHLIVGKRKHLEVIPDPKEDTPIIHTQKASKTDQIHIID